MTKTANNEVTRCRFKNCTKQTQSKCDGYCIAHFKFVHNLPPGKRGRKRRIPVPDVAVSSLQVITSSSGPPSALSAHKSDNSRKCKRANNSEKRAHATVVTCAKCLGDLTSPPPFWDCYDGDYKSTDQANNIIFTCAIKGCSAPKFHLACTGLPINSDVYINTVISGASKGELPTSLKCPRGKLPWWCQVSDTVSQFKRKNKPLQRDWPLQCESFICPNCDVEGTSRYLIEYFEKFRSMKKNFYAEYIGCNNKASERLARVDESVDSRTGQAFIWHLMKEVCGDHKIDRWNASEIQLMGISDVLTHLSGDTQLNVRHEKRHKYRLDLEPSYLVGMPIRLFNPIENSYHSGRIIDYKLDAPFEEDRCLSDMKPSASDAFFPEPDMKELLDEKILRTLYLVRFRHGSEGRKISVHQWIYLEEHAVAIGGEVCWAKVDNASDIGAIENKNKKEGEDKRFKSSYRPVQISYRSLLEMISLEELNSAVLALGFGKNVTHTRLKLDESINEMGQSTILPFTTSNPSWMNQMLNQARLSDDDLTLGVAMACMEKEEERRVRHWSNLPVS